MRPWVVLAGLNGLMAIGFAAWGAHGADAAFAPLVERGSLFQLLHAVLLLGIDRLAQDGRRLAHVAGGLFLAGMVLFAGSLYLKALSLPPPLPMTTPAGGVALILGWVVLTLVGLGRNSDGCGVRRG
ncbi:conserved membrane hypothetical protein [Candidatus Terasakiella magnetica]|nr:conserved membrane hypothetical protein [Candidatus Terasakiella magnetica]